MAFLIPFRALLGRGTIILLQVKRKHEEEDVFMNPHGKLWSAFNPSYTRSRGRPIRCSLGLESLKSKKTRYLLSCILDWLGTILAHRGGRRGTSLNDNGLLTSVPLPAKHEPGTHSQVPSTPLETTHSPQGALTTHQCLVKPILVLIWAGAHGDIDKNRWQERRYLT
jgi:hypothetical protein